MNRPEQVVAVCEMVSDLCCYNISESDFTPPSRNRELFNIIGRLSVCQTRLLEGLNDEALSKMVISITRELVVYHTCCVSGDTLE